MARQQRPPTTEAEYTYAVVPTVMKQFACKTRGGLYMVIQRPSSPIAKSSRARIERLSYCLSKCSVLLEGG